MSDKKKILIVEDDEDISMVEEAYLQSAGFDTVIISNGDEAVGYLKKEGRTSVDLVLLDLMLPGKNGYEVCHDVRDIINVPIIMVTARTESVDKIRGLGSGADDYIVKPFDPAELIARVNANLRQYERLTAGSPAAGIEEKPAAEIDVKDLRIMTDGYIVYKGDKEIRFPTKEFELLRFLAENPNIVFSKEQIFERIWGYDYSGDSATVMVHINRIREKIEDDPRNPEIIETVWGAGYRFNKK